MCSKAMPPQIRALFNLKPVCPATWYLTFLVFDFRYSHPGSHLPTSLSDFHVFPFYGVLRVVLFPPIRNFFSQSTKRQTCLHLPRKAFSCWRRSSRGSSQTMTAIVKGQISPCGFASDCMFISFWSGRDSKPLSRSPHSSNSWSSTCHWNRLMVDPGDRGGKWLFVTSVLARRHILLHFFSFKNGTDWPLSFSPTEQYKMKHVAEGFNMNMCFVFCHVEISIF